MEENKDIEKETRKLAKTANKEALNSLASLNKQTFAFFSDESVKSTIKQIKELSFPKTPLSSFLPNETLSSINTITNSYKEVLDSLEISKNALSSVADMQISTMLQLSQSVQTDMVASITKNLINARYDSLVGAINESINNSIIPSPDIGFICSSELISSYQLELNMPRGLVSAVKTINRSTARELSLDNSTHYDTSRLKFITLNATGETDAKGLNIICSGRRILNDSSGDEVFTIGDLVDFISFLAQTPMAALENDTGRRINSLIKDLFFNGARTIDFDKSVYYHCRSRKESEMEFTYEQMLKAPFGLPWAGRYNHIGQSHYYFSDTREGAEVEVKKHLSTNDVLQTIKIIPVRRIVLLDLSGTWKGYSLFLKYLRFSLHDNTDKMPREYLLPCFVSDCCKIVGFEGVKYYGSQKYDNYVTWGTDYFNYGGLCS